MITLFHFIGLAMHNLRRGGQRVLVALLCITFGIMALVAMNMLAQSIATAVIVPPAQLLGGDLSIGRKVENALRPEDVEQLQALQQSGAISRYTQIAFTSSIMFHTAASGEMHFVGSGLGIEPDNYPLAGSLTIGEPGSTGLTTLLQQIGDVVVTRDVADANHLKVGDPLILTNLRVGVPVEGKVRGIAYDTPNHAGDKIYYSIATAERLANGQPGVNTVIANTTQPEAVIAQLDAAGWSVDWAAGRRNEQTANMWVIGLRGGGILGLLVGGIGIANTMLVLLRRRQNEIAIWKTLGYRSGDLRLIFSIEAGLLGLVGSSLGAGLGVLASTGLLTLFRNTSSMLYAWTFSPVPPLMGVLVGTLATVIFAYWAIVITSQARPMALLRNEPINVQMLSGCQSISLGLLLAVPFTALTSLAMGSVLAGIGVLVCIVIGVAILGGFFSFLLWLCTRFIPLRGFPLARIAFNSLQRSRAALAFAMIALFIGVLSLSLGMLVMQISERRISGGVMDVPGYNVNILASADQASAVSQAIASQHPQKVGVGYRAGLKGLRMVGGAPLPAMDSTLVGRSNPDDYILSGSAWGSQPDGVYVYKWADVAAGSQVEATFLDGATKTFTVVGSYDINYRSANVYPTIGLLMTTEALNRVTRPDTIAYFVQVAPDQLDHATAALGAALPRATVVNLVAYAGRFMHSYQSLYLLPIVMSGMALLGGFLLVANSVSLAMLDRRYEIGILKTVGYSRRQILFVFAVEYGLVGLLATSAGVLIIQGLLAVFAIANHMASVVLLLSLPSLVVVSLCGIGLTLLTVLGVSWGPTRVSPVVVLNDM